MHDTRTPFFTIYIELPLATKMASAITTRVFGSFVNGNFFLFFLRTRTLLCILPCLSAFFFALLILAIQSERANEKKSFSFELLLSFFFQRCEVCIENIGLFNTQFCFFFFSSQFFYT